MSKLTPEEIKHFLTERHIGHLVSVRPDGRPHVAPVWFLVEGDRLYIVAESYSTKVANIRQRPSICLSVANDHPPYQHVILEGNATMRTRDFLDEVTQICVRYEGLAEGVAYAYKLMAEESPVLLDIRITRVVSWRDDE
jgi:PPOX class probable F420-dependent enzyme